MDYLSSSYILNQIIINKNIFFSYFLICLLLLLLITLFVFLLDLYFMYLISKLHLITFHFQTKCNGGSHLRMLNFKLLFLTIKYCLIF
jgi:hypothetical protein